MSRANSVSGERPRLASSSSATSVLVRRGSENKEALQEKFVVAFQSLFDSPEPRSDDWWDELLLLRVNKSFVERCIVLRSEQQLLEMKEVFREVFRQCGNRVQVVDRLPIRTQHALELNALLFRFLFRKQWPNFAYDTLSLFCGYDNADSYFPLLVRGLVRLLADETAASLRAGAVQLLAVLCSALDQVHDNALLEYVMMVDTLDALVPMAATAQFGPLAATMARVPDADQLLVSLAVMLQYQRFDSGTNAYYKRVSALDSASASRMQLGALCDIIARALVPATQNLAAFVARHTPKRAGWLSDALGLVLRQPRDPNLPAAGAAVDVPTVQHLAGVVVLLDLLSASSYLRSHMETMTQEEPVSTPSSPASSAAAAPPVAATAASTAAPPSAVTITTTVRLHVPRVVCNVMIWTSYVLSSTATSLPDLQLALLLLHTMASNDECMRYMHDTRITLALSPRCAPSVPPADAAGVGAAVRDAEVAAAGGSANATDVAGSREPTLAAQMHRILVSFFAASPHWYLPSQQGAATARVAKPSPARHLIVVGIMQRMFGYARRSKSKLHLHWRHYWEMLFEGARFIAAHEDMLIEDVATLTLLNELVTLLNVFITHGDEFFPSTAVYDRLYYEILRNADVLGRVRKLAEQYDAAGQLQADLVNLDGIVAFYRNRIDDAEKASGVLIESQVLALIRANYETLQLSMSTTVDELAQPPSYKAVMKPMLHDILYSYRHGYLELLVGMLD